MLSKKIIIILVIISLIVAGFSFRTPRARAADVFYYIYQWVILPLIRNIAISLQNRLLNDMAGFTSAIISKEPHFITNWRNNILSAQGRGNDIFRSVLADAKLCPYFKTNLQTAFGADKYVGGLSQSKAGKYSIGNVIPGLPSFQNQANCTLSSNINVDLFKKDFSNGGWSAWNELIKPQNNFFGAYSLALNEQSKQTVLEDIANQQQNIANKGYLPNKLGTIPFLGKVLPFAGGCLFKLPRSNRCIFEGKTVTPGSVYDQVNQEKIAEEMQRLQNITSIADILRFLGDKLAQKMSGQITNLLGLDLNDNVVLDENNKPIGQFENTEYQNELNEAGTALDIGTQACRSTCTDNYNQCVNGCPLDPSNSTGPEAQCSSDCSQKLNQCDSLCSQ